MFQSSSSASARRAGELGGARGGTAGVVARERFEDVAPLVLVGVQSLRDRVQSLRRAGGMRCGRVRLARSSRCSTPCANSVMWLEIKTVRQRGRAGGFREDGLRASSKA